MLRKNKKTPDAKAPPPFTGQHSKSGNPVRVVWQKDNRMQGGGFFALMVKQKGAKESRLCSCSPLFAAGTDNAKDVMTWLAEKYCNGEVDDSDLQTARDRRVQHITAPGDDGEEEGEEEPTSVYDIRILYQRGYKGKQQYDIAKLSATTLL